MWAVVVLAIVGLANSASVERRALTPMTGYQLDTFTQLFRKTLLEKVAVEWNVTIDQSHALKAKMDVCTTTIQGKAAPCKSCAQSRCQADPSFTDYLNLVNPYTYLKGPLTDMTSKLGDVVDLLGDQSMGFLNSVGDLAKSAGGTVYGGLSTAFNGLKHGVDTVSSGLTDAGNFVIDTAGLIGSGITDVGHTITDTATDIGHTVTDIGNAIKDGLGSIFGKKRREIDAKTRACMAQCDDCKPLLLPTQQQMIKAVCGDEIINTNNTINARVTQIKGIYDAALDKAHPIVSKVEFDAASMNAQMQLTNVYVTVYLKGQYQRYKTAVPYAMMDLPTTAKNIALEYWAKF